MVMYVALQPVVFQFLEPSAVGETVTTAGDAVVEKPSGDYQGAAAGAAAAGDPGKAVGTTPGTEAVPSLVGLSKSAAGTVMSSHPASKSGSSDPIAPATAAS